MSSVNFNGSIGKANINTGDGMQVTGDGANVNTGSGTINVGGQVFGDGSVPTVPQVFDAIKQALPEINHVSTDSDGMQATDESAAAEVEEQVLRPLQTLAELPPDEQNKPDTMQQAQSLLNRLVPYAPAIGKGLAVFGNAALASLAGSNPIISGILAVCKMASDSNSSQTA